MDKFEYNDPDGVGPGTLGMWVTNTSYLAQQFTPQCNFALSRIVAMIRRWGNLGYLVVEIRSVDGNGKPTSEVLLTTSILSGLIGTSYSLITIDFVSSISLTSGVTYALVLHTTATPDWENEFADFNVGGWQVNRTNSYSRGNGLVSHDSCASWEYVYVEQEGGAYDMCFEIWGSAEITHVMPLGSYRLLPGKTDGPGVGVEGIDWQWTGLNCMTTIRRLVAVTNNKFWYET